MSKIRVIAIEDYAPKNAEEIELNSGKIYSVLEVKDEMFRVTNNSGASGWAPSNILVPMDADSNTKTEKICDVCKKHITEQFVSTKDKIYHRNCFQCQNCKEQLAGKAYIKDEEKIYCEKCFSELKSPKCAHCNEAIKTAYITAMGKNWHPEHFVCTICGEKNKDTFRKYKDKPYCEKCFLEKVLSKCSKCNKALDLNAMIEVANLKLHPDCFVCEYDKKKLDIEESIKVKENKVYCEEHFLNFVVKKCNSCNKPMLGQYVSVLEKNFHSECLNCEMCGNNLSNSTPMISNGKLLCMDDVAKLQKEEKEKKEREEKLKKEKEEKQKKEREEKEKKEREEKERKEREEKERKEKEEKEKKEMEEKERKEREEKERKEKEKKEREEKEKREKEEKEREMQNKEESIKRYYKDEELKTDNLPAKFNKSRKEEFLEEDVFFSHYKMTLKEFKKLPLFKQKQLKRAQGHM